MILFIFMFKHSRGCSVLPGPVSIPMMRLLYVCKLNGLILCQGFDCTVFITPVLLSTRQHFSFSYLLLFTTESASVLVYFRCRISIWRPTLLAEPQIPNESHSRPDSESVFHLNVFLCAGGDLFAIFSSDAIVTSHSVCH